MYILCYLNSAVIMFLNGREELQECVICKKKSQSLRLNYFVLN